MMGRHINDVLPLQQHLTLVRTQKAEHRLERRGLAHSVGAENRCDLVFARLDIEVLQDIKILVVTHVQVTQFEHDIVVVLSHRQASFRHHAVLSPSGLQSCRGRPRSRRDHF